MIDSTSVACRVRHAKLSDKGGAIDYKVLKSMMREHRQIIGRPVLKDWCKVIAIPGV